MNLSRQTILVLGSTGTQGGAVAWALLSRGFSVRALTRDPKKPAAQTLAGLGATLVQGDLSDAASLAAAMQGVHGVFSVQTPYGPGGVEKETLDGIAVADAAKAADVSHLVYSSVGGAERSTGIPHFDSKYRVEQHIRKSGVHATVLRPVFFMSNFAGPGGPQTAGGELVLRMAITPDTRLQMIAPRDIGVFAALAFEEREGIDGQSVEIAGDELTGQEMAATFAKAAGRPVRFEQLPTEQLEKKSAEAAKMFRWFVTDGYRANLAALRRLHPTVTTLAGWIADEHWQPKAS